MRHHYFRHFRLFDERGNLLPRGGVTLYVRHFTWAYDRGPGVAITTSVCSYKDPYNKRLGRRVAFGRRCSPSEITLVLDSEDQDITNELHGIAKRALDRVQFKGKYNKLSLIHKHGTLDCNAGVSNG